MLINIKINTQWNIFLILKSSVKIVHSAYYYRKQIESYNKTVYNILMKEIPLILSNFQKNKKGKERYNYFISNKLYWLGIWRDI